MWLHRRVYGHRKRVCTESWLWEENPLPHWEITPVSMAWRSEALTNWAISHPQVGKSQLLFANSRSFHPLSFVSPLPNLSAVPAQCCYVSGPTLAFKSPWNYKDILLGSPCYEDAILHYTYIVKELSPLLMKISVLPHKYWSMPFLHACST